MTLSAGTRLGPYEVLSPVGAGGMGEVYRARDARLEREVAIKVLPEEVAGNAERLRRFEGEARAVAALSHPNVLAIYDFGYEDGVAYVVAELLAGETLRQRLQVGPLPPRKAATIAAGIAHGLAAAHERGIVHRDVKPENVFVTGDGRVKLLDFGLARAMEAAASDDDGRTLTRHTDPGKVVGTAGYMAPEQVRAAAVDARTDLFALGCVLHEMLTGRPTFGRESAADTMAAILREDAAALPPTVPPALARIVEHCLEKRPQERFQSARDLAFDLEAAAGLSTTRTGSGVPQLEADAGWWRGRQTWKVAAALLAGLLVGIPLGLVLRPRGLDGSTLRPTFRQLTKLPGGEGTPSLSPDGEGFVFVKEVEGRRHLFLQRVDGQNAIDLTKDSPDDNSEPAFSPDGRLIAFRSGRGGGGIFVMGATGESVRKVTDWGFAPAWSPDGRELAVVEEGPGLPWARRADSRLWAVRVDTGERRLLSEHDAVQPSWSPHGQRVAFWGLRGDTVERDLWTVAADGSTARKEQARAVTADSELDWNPVWSSDGRDLYFASTRGGTMNLWRVAIEEATGETRGRPEPVTAPSSWAGWVSVSRSGRRLVFVDRNARDTILRASLDPVRNVLLAPPTQVFRGSFELFDQTLSPDGQAVVFSTLELHQHLFYLRADGSELRQLTDGPYRDRFADFAPDGKSIAFQTTRYDHGLAIMGVDGSGLRGLFPALRTSGGPTLVWSTDGRQAVVSQAEARWICEASSGSCQPLSVEPGTTGGDPRSASSPQGFWTGDWSADGDLLVGNVTVAGGRGRALYSLRQRRFLAVTADESAGPPKLNLRFMPDGRHLVMTSREGMALFDLGLRPVGTLFAAPGTARLRAPSLSRDGRWFSFIESADESDIWLMSLEEESPP